MIIRFFSLSSVYKTNPNSLNVANYTVSPVTVSSISEWFVITNTPVLLPVSCSFLPFIWFCCCYLLFTPKYLSFVIWHSICNSMGFISQQQQRSEVWIQVARDTFTHVLPNHARIQQEAQRSRRRLRGPGAVVCTFAARSRGALSGDTAARSSGRTALIQTLDSDLSGLSKLDLNMCFE